jgi:hypothetical protein
LDTLPSPAVTVRLVNVVDGSDELVPEADALNLASHTLTKSSATPPAALSAGGCSWSDDACCSATGPRRKRAWPVRRLSMDTAVRILDTVSWWWSPIASICRPSPPLGTGIPPLSPPQLLIRSSTVIMVARHGNKSTGARTSIT